MRTKFMTSAVALMGVLAFATVSHAQSERGGGGHDNGNGNDEQCCGIEDSFNTDNSVEDSFNTDNSQHNFNLRVSLNHQELSANVSDVSVDMSEADRGANNARLRTGDIRQNGGSFAGFAGIQTVSNNTGLASIGQAATAVSANASVNFGGSGGE